MILLTGGCGFIGSHLVRMLLASGKKVVNIDKLTYAGCLDSLVDIAGNPGYCFVHGDICDEPLLEEVFRTYRPKVLLHLAAESHVDRSIDDPDAFVRTNINGTYSLLKTARRYWSGLDGREKNAFRFLHVSTDEVFGSLGATGFFTEETPYAPRSPYSASKAASDHLVKSYFHTYSLPVLMTNSSNNYGPNQFPEKLIPMMIISALEEKCLPVYGDGKNVRDWLFVEDHCRALIAVCERGRVGERYNIGGNCERTNLQVVTDICEILDELLPRKDGRSYRDQIAFVQDRPGHDRRYAVCTEKIVHDLGWTPQETFSSGLRHTVKWYLGHREWTEIVREKKYALERLGLNACNN